MKISINGTDLSYTTVKHLIINMSFCPETSQKRRKECVIEMLTELHDTQYDIRSYLMDITDDHELASDVLDYSNDIIEISRLVAIINKEKRV